MSQAPAWRGWFYFLQREPNNYNIHIIRKGGQPSVTGSSVSGLAFQRVALNNQGFMEISKAEYDKYVINKQNQDVLPAFPKTPPVILAQPAPPPPPPPEPEKHPTPAPGPAPTPPTVQTDVSTSEFNLGEAINNFFVPPTLTQDRARSLLEELTTSLNALDAKTQLTETNKSQITTLSIKASDLFLKVLQGGLGISSDEIFPLQKLVNKLVSRLSEPSGPAPGPTPTPTPTPGPTPTPTPGPAPGPEKPGSVQEAHEIRLKQRQEDKDEISTGILDFFSFIDKEYKKAVDNFVNFLNIDKVSDPDNALANAIKIAIPAFGAGFAIYSLATSTDLIHPLKGTGIVPAAIDIVDALGPKVITGSIAAAFTYVALRTPLTYYYNSKARQFRPGGSIVDQMFFEGNISLEQWRKLYAYQGWPDDLIDAQYKTMFIEPTDRLLLGMFEDPLVPQDWLTLTLKARGYDPLSVQVLVDYAKRRASDKLNLAKQATYVKRFVKGFDTLDLLKLRLNLTDLKPAQINQVAIDAVLQRDIEQRQRIIDVATTLFVKGVFNEDLLRANIKQAVPDPLMQEDYLQIAFAKRKEKIEDDKLIKPAEGPTAAAINLYVEGSIDDKQLAIELSKLNKPRAEIDVLLVAANQEKQLSVFRESQKEAKAKKDKITVGRSSAAVRRFVNGYTADMIFDAELRALGISQAEITVTKIEAIQQRDEKFRQKAIDNFEDLFDKDLINEDQLESELEKYITNPTVLEQTILAAKIKKYKKPKSA